ncbi:MAG TPA: hypothetical protein VHB54_10840 [Mucilaginibacter sp.]|nr:hypothetical protein [Mucilaginibacter sp.]
MKPFISTKVYGFFNWVATIGLFASPWLFGFDNLHGAALLMPIIYGWLQFLMVVFSNHELGFIKVFPVSMHCFLDVLGGSFLLASPFVYGFYHEVVWPQVLLGGLVLLFGLFTQHSPFTDEPRHVFKDGLLNHTADVDELMIH